MSALKIKVTCEDSTDIIRFHSPRGCCKWGNCEYYINSNIDECDYWVVFYSIEEKESVHCQAANTVFITGEPASVKKYNRHFLQQFATVITPQENVHHHNVIHTHQILPWFVKKTYDELVSEVQPEKTHLLSIVASNKRITKDHEQRYQFVLALKKYFGDRADLFGRGINEFYDKWSVLAPYKYSVCIENIKAPDYITEKLADTFLSYTFPFYCGCPNIEDYYPVNSFEMIDITNLDGAIDTIERIISDENHYSAHVSQLQMARDLYLKKYSIFPALTSIINSIASEKYHHKSSDCLVTLEPEKRDIIDYIGLFHNLPYILRDGLSKKTPMILRHKLD